MIPVALSSWSLHTLFLNRESSGLKAADFPRLARECFGLGAIEFYEGDYAPDFLDPAFDDLRHALAIARQCRNHDIRVVCLAAVNDLTQKDDRLRAKDRERILRLARHCEELRCPVIRINSGRLCLDDARASRLRDELLLLSDRLAGRNVELAVENHPQVLGSDREADLLVRVVQDLARPNIRTCPDLGAMGPGYWKDGLVRLLRFAAHVHLKPFVREVSTGPAGRAGGPSDGHAPEVRRIVERPLADYAREVRRILEANRYRGAVSFEAIPSLGLTADPIESCRRSLAELASAFDAPLGPATSAGLPSRTPAKRTVNEDPELVPSTGILQLLADGCERRLDAQTRIHDFGSGMVVLSQSAAHRPDSCGPGDIDAGHFCAIVDRDPTAAGFCAEFYKEKLALIRDGLQDAPRICICPMGLMVLSVPVLDAETVYGAISTGPWVEEGTEGMVVDAILHRAAADRRDSLEQASLRIDAYSPDRLMKTQRLLGQLAGDLAGLYHEHQRTRRYLSEGTQLIQWMHDRSRDDGAPDPESFVNRTLGEAIRKFNRLVGFGQIALYRRATAPGRAAELVRVVFPGDPGGLPSVVPLPPATGPISTERARAELDRIIPHLTRQQCLTGGHGPADFFVVFCYPRDLVLPGDLRSFFLQFATETYYVLANLRNLREADERRKELILFTNRFKHAITSPLQGIIDRVAQMRKSFSGRRPLTFEQLREVVRDLEDDSNRVDAVLDRFTGFVRVEAEEAALRPQLNFAVVDVAEIIEGSVRKWTRAAARRQISIKKVGLDRPIHLEGDSDALTEVFDNLVENAVKFSHDGMTIDVRALNSSEVITPPWRLPDAGRRLVVSNRGLGLAPEELETVFKPLQQGRAHSKSRVIPGTGLGLTICRHIISEHRGRIGITSRPASGPSASDALQDAYVEVYVDLAHRVPQAAPPSLVAGGS
jgi:signal transduction histidine kinase/sugar phosphate isomerase/epimerase